MATGKAVSYVFTLGIDQISAYFWGGAV